MIAKSRQIPSRDPVAGSAGWTAADLDDPTFESAWIEGRFEMLEGVLTPMPAAYFDGGRSLFRLLKAIDAHVQKDRTGGEIAVESDVILSPVRVVIADAVYLTPEALKAQIELQRAMASRAGIYGRLRVPPSLIVESVSVGHEAHDRTLKRQWYAEAGVPHYWLLDAYARSLECLILEGDTYRTAAFGRGSNQLRVPLFDGLELDLSSLWPEMS